MVVFHRVYLEADTWWTVFQTSVKGGKFPQGGKNNPRVERRGDYIFTSLSCCFLQINTLPYLIYLCFLTKIFHYCICG